MSGAMECSCTVDFCDGEPAECSTVRMRKARQDYRCCECRETIPRGAEYEHVRGLWDGSWSTYRTCIVCVRIRQDHVCGSFCVGMLREDLFLALGFDYVTGRAELARLKGGA